MRAVREVGALSAYVCTPETVLTSAVRVFIVSQYPAAKRGNQPENAMTKEEAKKKQLLAAYAWGRHSAAAPQCFELDVDKLATLVALGVMPPRVVEGAGSTPATGSAGKGVSVGERPAVTCVATTTNTKSAGEKSARHTPGPWTVLSEGVTAMLTEVVETLDAQKMVAQLKVAPEMLAEHRRTLGQLERMQVMTKHLAKTDPLAEEIAAAIKGTKAIIAKAEGGE